VGSRPCCPTPARAWSAAWCWPPRGTSARQAYSGPEARMALWLPVAAYTGRERVRWGPGSPCDHTLRCSASCALPHATAPAPGHCLESRSLSWKNLRACEAPSDRAPTPSMRRFLDLSGGKVERQARPPCGRGSTPSIRSPAGLAAEKNKRRVFPFVAAMICSTWRLFPSQLSFPPRRARSHSVPPSKVYPSVPSRGQPSSVRHHTPLGTHIAL